MWILFLLATFASVLAFNTQHQRLALLIITFLATSAFQLLSTRWFASPVILSKPYDYAYLAMLMIILLNINKFAKTIASERIAMLAVVYVGFVALALVASVTVFSYAPVQAFQSARVFAWPLFLVLFLMTERKVLEQFVRTLLPIVIVTSILYLLQPLTGLNIIAPDSVVFNPYLGATEFKRFLSTPDFLIFFVMLFYYELCASKVKSLGVMVGRVLGLLLMLAVQLVSFTRSAIGATGLALIYLSKRMLNSLMVSLFLVSAVVAGAVAYTSSSAVETRVDDSWKDITSIVDGQFLTWRRGDEGTLSFRLAHLHERASYVFADITRWPIGLGFIHEDSAVAQNLGFKIGGKDPRTGRAVQVDTGDIAWSAVVIKTGFLGLALMIVFLIGSNFTVGASSNKYAVVYRGGLTYYLVTSFFSSNFTLPNIVLPLMLFLALAIRERQGLAGVDAAGK